MTAIQVTAGEPLSTFLSYVDEDQNPVIGATFETIFAEKPDGSTFSVSVTDRGNGIYDVDGTTELDDPPGEWKLELLGSVNQARFQQIFDVIRGRPVVVIAQPPTVSGVSRSELRRMIAGDLGDFKLVIADADGTESTVVSQRDLSQEYNHFAGMQIYCVSGTPDNIGLTSTIRISDEITRTATFVPPFPVATYAGDVFELYNVHGLGWTKEQYDLAINSAITRAGQQSRNEPYGVLAAGYFDRRYPDTAIPAEFSHFSGVEIIDASGARKPVPAGQWRVDTFSRTVTLTSKWQEKAHGKQLRLLGHRRPGTLETDDARTSVPAEWLVAEAKAQLLEANTSTDLTQGSRARLYYQERQGADGRRPMVLSSYPPNTVYMG